MTGLRARLDAAACPSRDFIAQAARGMSTCIFGPTEGIGDVVTVVTENGLPAKGAVRIVVSAPSAETTKDLDAAWVVK
jgi:hypothetical protein